MKFGISFLYFQKDFQCDFKKAIKRASSLGFDILEIDTTQLLPLTEKEAMSIVDYAEANGIELFHSFCLGNDTDISSDDDQIRDNGYNFILKILDLVHAAGGTSVGGINYVGHNCFDGELNPEHRRSNSAAVLREIMPVCEKYNIKYNFEVTNAYENFIINTAKQAKSFCNHINSDAAGILLDLNHMLTEEDSLSGAIFDADEKLNHFHIAQNNRKVPKEEGFIPWDSISDALKSIKYTGAITLEPIVLAYGEVGRGARLWRNKCDSVNDDALDRDISNSLKFVKKQFGK